MPKGSLPTIRLVQPPPFNSFVDMDLRLVLAFSDLPREAEVSSLILRFGGEYELVWPNEKNALAIFIDPARTATTLRRLDHASVYQGANCSPS
jgi:transcriptional repressor NF-X1